MGSDRPLEVQVKRQPVGAVVSLRGSASADSAEQLRAALDGLAEQGCRQVVLDLTELEFIGSAGLGAIVAGHLRLRCRGGVLKLVGPSQPVRRMLELTRLTKLFGVYGSVAEAISAEE